MIDFDRIKTLIPFSELEASAIDQLAAVASEPWLERMAVMPDCHTGYDLPIGCIAATRGVVIPAFVGFDIGCGMMHMNTGRTIEECGLADIDARRRLHAKIKAAIPCGVGREHEAGNPCVRLDGADNFTAACGDDALTKKVRAKANSQLGTLGAGNHYIEVGVNSAGIVGITLHSGSRNVGHSIADWYIKNCHRVLDENSTDAKNYLEDYSSAAGWAEINRAMMMYAIGECMCIPAGDISSCSHNMVSRNTDGTWLHRKGATPAREGDPCIIPGSMASGVAIGYGLGNTEYLGSCSHGAGRRMGRNQAKRTLSIDAFTTAMQGVVCEPTVQERLDEAPEAYKDFEAVLAAQNGVVVRITDIFRPLINIKG